MQTPIITKASFKKCARQIIDEANISASTSGQRDIADFFGFADDAVIDSLYSKAGKWLYASYGKDESFEHKIAYIAVTIILDHSLVDGNKRAGVFAMLILLCCAGRPLGFSDEGLTTFQLFDLAYNIAAEGNDKRDENIDKLTSIIQDLI